MKFLPVLVAVFGMVSSASAQTNSSAYVPKAADLRIVEGQMYNRVLNTNWMTLPAKGGSLEVLDVISDGLVVKGVVKDGKTETVMIKNHPDQKKLVKGKSITTPFRAMPVADVKYGKEKVAAYDCGLANTPENRKSLQNGPIHAAGPQDK